MRTPSTTYRHVGYYELTASRRQPFLVPRRILDPYRFIDRYITTYIYFILYHGSWCARTNENRFDRARDRTRQTPLAFSFSRGMRSFLLSGSFIHVSSDDSWHVKRLLIVDRMILETSKDRSYFLQEIFLYQKKKDGFDLLIQGHVHRVYL